MIIIVGGSPRASEMLDIMLAEGIKDIVIAGCTPEPIEPPLLEQLRIPEIYHEPLSSRKPRRSGQKIRPTW